MSRSNTTVHQIIQIQPHASHKPPVGAACNGCGICCLAEPCPVGVVLSLSRVGPCKALRWVDAERQYRCGALGDCATGLRARVIGRWIGAGAGCDCDLEGVPSFTIAASTVNHNDVPHD